MRWNSVQMDKFSLLSWRGRNIFAYAENSKTHYHGNPVRCIFLDPKNKKNPL